MIPLLSHGMLGRLGSSTQNGLAGFLSTAARNLTTYPSDLKSAFAEQIPVQQVILKPDMQLTFFYNNTLIIAEFVLYDLYRLASKPSRSNMVPRSWVMSLWTWPLGACEGLL